jgi:hypothetical protein
MSGTPFRVPCEPNEIIVCMTDEGDLAKWKPNWETLSGPVANTRITHIWFVTARGSWAPDHHSFQTLAEMHFGEAVSQAARREAIENVRSLVRMRFGVRS